MNQMAAVIEELLDAALIDHPGLTRPRATREP